MDDKLNLDDFVDGQIAMEYLLFRQELNLIMACNYIYMK